MDAGLLTRYGRAVQAIVGSATRVEIEKQVEQLAADGAWDLCGPLLLSATELGARVLIDRLMQAHVYTPLAYAACMRRQIKRQEVMTKRVAMSRRVYRDIDAEAETKGVPDHIRAELDDLASTAEESRDIADRRDADRDACPVRAHVVSELAGAMLHEEQALEALVAVVRASAFEDTRHSAALKIITQPLALKRLSDAKRVDDLVAAALAARLESAAVTVAEILGPSLDELAAQRRTAALKLLAKHHPHPVARERATEALK